MVAFGYGMAGVSGYIIAWFWGGGKEKTTTNVEKKEWEWLLFGFC